MVFKLVKILVIVTISTVPVYMQIHPAIIQQPDAEVNVVLENSLPSVDLKPFDNFTISHFYQHRELINISFILNCTATGDPYPNFTWKKDGSFFNLSILRGRVTQVSGTGSLLFLKPMEEDAGQYQCFAENEFGTAASDIALVRIVRSTTLQFVNFTLFENAVVLKPAVLKCGYSSMNDWPKPQLYWTSRDGIPENRTAIDPEGNLCFSKTIPSDSKIYICVAKTQYQSIPVRSVKLILKHENHSKFSQPQHVYVSRSRKVISGQSIDLCCLVDYDADYNITWVGPGFSKLNWLHLSIDETGQILRLKEVHPSDHHEYFCQISYDGGRSISVPINLTVLEKPKFKQSPKSQTKKRNETAIIRCEAIGVPPPQVKWYFNGQEIPNNTHPRCHNRGTSLEIVQLTTHESGNFACNASNEVGYVYQDSCLHVEDITDERTTMIVISIVIIILIIIIITVYLWIKRIKKREQESDNISEDAVFMAHSDDPWQFPRRRLILMDTIGAGNFGRVFLAEAKFEENVNEDSQQRVAVKTTQTSAPDYAHEDLLRELAIMKQLGNHPNVVRLIGACSERTPILLIMELLSESLHQFLRKAQANKYYDLPAGASLRVTSQNLISFGVQVARGMEHVSSQGIIHRDLATRNILLTSDLVCKIADFGLARELNEEHIYVRQRNVPLPIRWMSPESISSEETSTKSDVWSFGVLLWELSTLGATPYQNKRVNEVKHMVQNGKLMEKPKTCDVELYSIMLKCWQFEPDQRPDFKRCTELLSGLLLMNGDYIDLDDFPEHEYYNIVKGEGEIV